MKPPWLWLKALRLPGFIHLGRAVKDCVFEVSVVAVVKLVTRPGTRANS